MVSDIDISHKLQENVLQAMTDNGNWSAQPSIWRARATFLNDTLSEILRAGVTNADSWEQIEFAITTAAESVQSGVKAVMQGATDPSRAVQASHTVLQIARIIIFQVAGFSPATTSEYGEDSPSRPASDEAVQSARKERKTLPSALSYSKTDTLAVQDIWTVFALTYIYLFVSMGFVLLVLTVVEALGRKRQPRTHQYGFILSGALGLGLCLLATMIVTEKYVMRCATKIKTLTYISGVVFLSSPWVLPTIMLTLMAAVILTSIRIVV